MFACATYPTFDQPFMENVRQEAEDIMEYRQRSIIANDAIVRYLLQWFQLPTLFESLVWASQILQALAMQYAVDHWCRNMPRCMGALYWQLNDCWQAPSWSSIDYSGYWKALHFVSKRFFAPVMLSAVDNPEDFTVSFYLTHDGTDVAAGMLQWQVTHADGRLIDSGNISHVRPNAARQVIIVYHGKQALAEVQASLRLRSITDLWR